MESPELVGDFEAFGNLEEEERCRSSFEFSLLEAWQSGRAPFACEAVGVVEGGRVGDVVAGVGRMAAN